MKNKKFLYIAIIAVLILAIGIGYAAVTKTLNIGGNATVSAADGDDFIVQFTGTPETNDKCTAVINSDKTTGTITIAAGKLSKVGDKATATFTVTNTSASLRATMGTIDATITGNASDYLTITAAYPSATPVLDAVNGTTTVTVTITLTKLPIEAAVTGTINVSFDATATALAS